MILLSIRTALKSDLRCSAAELVNGTTLCLPGEFFQQSASVDPASLLNRLKTTMRQLCATLVRPQSRHKVHVDNQLFPCVTILSANFSSLHMMDPIAYCPETPSSSSWTLMDDRTLCP